MIQEKAKHCQRFRGVCGAGIAPRPSRGEEARVDREDGFGARSLRSAPRAPMRRPILPAPPAAALCQDGRSCPIRA